MRAYQRSLMQEGGRQGRHTLSGLDSLRYTPQGVERTLLSLDAKIHALGVDIAEPVNLETNELACRRYEEFGAFLKCEIGYSTESAPLHDAHCVTSIYAQRDGVKSTDVEKCRSLFVTPNSLLARLAKIPNNEKESEYVPLSMLDGDFASIVWLKCYGTHRDYPKMKLMEDVSLATLPSDDIIAAFLGNVDEYEKQGGLTAEAAATLRAGYYNKRALMGGIEGELNRIDFDTVREMEAQVRADIALEEIEKRRDAEQKLAINERKTAELKKGIYDEIEKAGIEAGGGRVRKRLTVLAWVAFVAIGLISLAGVFMDTI